MTVTLFLVILVVRLLSYGGAEEDVKECLEPSATLTNALNGLISHLRWSRVHILFDDCHRSLATELSQILAKRHLFLTWVHLESSLNSSKFYPDDLTPLFLVLMTSNSTLMSHLKENIYAKFNDLRTDVFIVVQYRTTTERYLEFMDGLPGVSYLVNVTGLEVAPTVFKKWPEERECDEPCMEEYSLWRDWDQLSEGQRIGHLRIGFTPDPAFYDIKEDEEGRILSAKGLCPDFVKVLARKLNFTYEWVRYESFGVLRFGSWEGMAGGLIRKEIDFVPCMAQATLRMFAIGYAPVANFRIEARWVFRKPDPEASVSFGTMTTMYLWLLLLATMVVISFVLRSAFNVNRPSISRAFYIVWSAFTMQGVDFDSRRMSARTVFICFLFLVIVVINSYCSDITSMSVSRRIVLPFHTSHELVIERDQWKLGIPAGTAVDAEISTDDSKMPLIIKTLKKKVEENLDMLVFDYKAGLEKVYRERYVFFVSDLHVRYWTGINCSYTHIFWDKSGRWLHAAATKDFLHLQTFQRYLARMKEVGITKRIYDKYNRMQLVDCSMNTASWKAASFSQMIFPFGALTIGLASCASILLAEILLFWFRVRVKLPPVLDIHILPSARK